MEMIVLHYLFINDYYINYPTKKFLLTNMIIAMGGYAAETILLNLSNQKIFTMKNIYIFNYI